VQRSGGLAMASTGQASKTPQGFGSLHEGRRLFFCEVNKSFLILLRNSHNAFLISRRRSTLLTRGSHYMYAESFCNLFLSFRWSNSETRSFKRSEMIAGETHRRNHLKEKKIPDHTSNDAASWKREFHDLARAKRKK
jgi:hypothetical protein